MQTIAQKEDWQRANQEYLLACLERMKQLLQQASDKNEMSSTAASPDMEQTLPAALDALCAWLHLSPFERDILLLCAGIELDSAFGSLCAVLQADAACNYPTFSLALAVLPQAHWSALSPQGPLRRWQLIEVETSRTLTLSPLRINERILHYLLGISYLDKQLADLFQPVAFTGPPLVPSHQKIVQELVNAWKLAEGHEQLPAIQLCGGEMLSLRNIAVVACSLLNHTVFVVSASALPTQPGELESLLHCWERETLLNNNALLLDCQFVDVADMQRESVIARVIEANKGLLIVAGSERRTGAQHFLFTFEVEKPTRDEQRATWQTVLGDQATTLSQHIEKLTAHFHLSSEAIYAVCLSARARLASEGAVTTDAIGETLWNISRRQANLHLDGLAQHIEATATWADLVLPEEQIAVLQDIMLQVRHRTRVYETWGFSSKGTRGLGISALFAGASGVGKTMAAEVLANELHLELYRIDLSAVVSKYIGETEKNLRRIFDAAEGSGVILLFDEADALFGKRSEVKDSHDRYANIEVSYLLQRMESYRGLAILTSNLKDALDNAFLRRIRFIVQLPFPDATQRAEIWRRVFPPALPTRNLDVNKLAQLNVAGGTIRNIAMSAAFIAADSDEPMSMSHILRAARHEYTKLEKSLSSMETRGWEKINAD
ncbi:MAG TPA: AAA family ATPase [Ktedonobacteraceae bacterium]|nr:AAA family ATPase [Ktedonobacteraceae bacterium]